MNVRSSRSHTIFRMVLPLMYFRNHIHIGHHFSDKFIGILIILSYMQVIESKGKDNNSSNYSCGDAIRVSVLVCIIFTLPY